VIEVGGGHEIAGNGFGEFLAKNLGFDQLDSARA
jgi:hypothetical protein